MASETLAATKWIRARLVNDPTLGALIGQRVFADFAPEKDPSDPNEKPPVYPLLVFSMQAAPDSLGMRARRLLTRPLFLIQVIGEGGGYGDIQAAADQVDALLDQAPQEDVNVNGTDYRVGGCHRERPVQHSELSRAGLRYCYLGGYYRLYVNRI